MATPDTEFGFIPFSSIVIFTGVRTLSRKSIDWIFAPATRRQKRFFAVSVSFLLVAACAVHFASTARPFFPVDDAYITLHNAKVLKAGEDDNFSGVAPVTGTTSPLHLLLVTFMLFAFEPERALLAASWVGVTLYVLGLIRLVWANSGSVIQATLALATGLMAGLTLHQLFNGMETGLAMAGLVWALVLANENRESTWWLRPCVYGILPFLRPELIVVTVILLAVDISRQNRSHSRTRVLLVAAIAVLAATPWIVWFSISTGALYPTTIEAKKLFFAEGCLPANLKKAWVFRSLSHFVTTLGALSAGTFFLVRRRLGWAGLVFTVVFVATYYVNFPGALGHYEQRYLYILSPFLLYGILTGLQESSRFWRASAFMFLALATGESALRLPRAWETARQNRRFTQAELHGVAEWCSTNLPEGATLLIHDAGFISHATNFNLVDFVGLKTPSSVDYHRRLTWPTCGTQRTLAVHEIARDQRPDYLVMLEDWDRIYRITRGLEERGWRLISLRGGDGDGPAYQVYRLEPP
jgi:hypothetical protein